MLGIYFIFLSFWREKEREFDILSEDKILIKYVCPNSGRFNVSLKEAI